MLRDEIFFSAYIQHCNAAFKRKDDYIIKYKITFKLLGFLNVILGIVLIVCIVAFSYYYSNYKKIYHTNEEIYKQSEKDNTLIDKQKNTILELEQKYETIKQKNNILSNDLNILKKEKAKYIGKFKITYYCSCNYCCGKNDGITASGIKAKEGITVAADTSILPFGTNIYIGGVGQRVVQDKGGAINGNKIDVYVSSHDQIPSVGVHNSDVWLVIC